MQVHRAPLTATVAEETDAHGVAPQVGEPAGVQRLMEIPHEMTHELERFEAFGRRRTLIREDPGVMFDGPRRTPLGHISAVPIEVDAGSVRWDVDEVIRARFRPGIPHFIRPGAG